MRGVFGRFKWLRLVALGAVLLGGVLSFAFADNDDAAPSSSRVPKPNVVIEKGDRCVEDEEFMRKNHMKLLMHQRDETMHKGIRTSKYSLKNCIECHASKKNNSVLGSNDNFCQACHSYAAVKIDCFECHATKPKAAAAFHPIVPPAGKTDANTQGLSDAMRRQMHASAVPQEQAGVAK